MNKVIQMGRLTRDPEIRVTAGENQTTVARFSIAVDRRFDRSKADFFDWTAFGKLAEFVEKYMTKGTKVLVSGLVENNNYTKQDGTKVYGFQFTAEEIEFAESKKAQQGGQDQQAGQEAPAPAPGSGWMSVPDNMDDADLPFN